MTLDPKTERTTHDIVHDLNNLLASIIGYADFLQEDLHPGTPQHKFAESIFRGGVEAQDLVAQLIHNGTRAFANRTMAAPAVNHHILIVEDQQDVREMMLIMVERLGGTAEACADAFQAIDVLRENLGQYHLVIADHEMPGMTGSDLAAAIEDDFPDLPVILMSGMGVYDLEKLRERTPSVRAILQKPVDFSKLAELIHSVL